MSIEALKRNMPRFELGEVRALAREHQGIDGGFTQQDSERDLSWRVCRGNGDSAVPTCRCRACRE